MDAATPFLTIVFTAPATVSDEASKIVRLFEAGADRVHIRKPGATASQLRGLIEQIPSRWRSRLRLHDHLELAAELGVGGVHLNNRNPEAPRDAALCVSRSCHSTAELELTEQYEYVTLSPIFDSISKRGYASAFDLSDIGRHIAGKRVIALGGIKPEHLAGLREKGFSGAALLGYIWEGRFESALEQLEQTLVNLKKS